MQKIGLIAACSLSAVAIGLSSWSLVRSFTPEKHETEYAMYVGTNDKETYKLEISIDEARDIVHNTLMDHFPNGFTMYDAKGVWRDEKNVVTLEYTFVCIIENVQRAEIYKVADELLVSLNQSTILVVENLASAVTFYQGNGQI